MIQLGELLAALDDIEEAVCEQIGRGDEGYTHPYTAGHNEGVSDGAELFREKIEAWLRRQAATATASDTT